MTVCPCRKSVTIGRSLKDTVPFPRTCHAWVTLWGSSYSNFRSKDELHLTLKFENLSSKHLPSKIELEIRDSTGQCGFQETAKYILRQDPGEAVDSRLGRRLCYDSDFHHRDRQDVRKGHHPQQALRSGQKKVSTVLDICRS